MGTKRNLIKLEALVDSLNASSAATQQALEAKEKTEAAIANAAAAAGVTEGYLSTEMGVLPTTDGAVNGQTVGAYYTDDGYLQLVKFTDNAWEPIGNPVSTTAFVEGFVEEYVNDGGVILNDTKKFRQLRRGSDQQFIDNFSENGLPGGALGYTTGLQKMLDSSLNPLSGLRDSGKKVNSIAGLSGDIPTFFEKLFSEAPMRNVLGYHDFKSDGDGLFVWDNDEPRANHNGGTVISPTWDNGGWADIVDANWFQADPDDLDTGCWKRIFKDGLKAAYFGLKNDNATNNSVAYSYLDSFADANGYDIVWERGTYRFTEPITVNVSNLNNSSIGSYQQRNVRWIFDDPNATQTWINPASGSYRGIDFRPAQTRNHTLFNGHFYRQGLFNCQVSQFDIGCDISGVYAYFKDTYIYDNNIGIYPKGREDGRLSSMFHLEDTHFQFNRTAGFLLENRGFSDSNEVYGLEFNNCGFENNPGDGLVITDTTEWVSIHHCWEEANDGTGFVLTGAKVIEWNNRGNSFASANQRMELTPVSISAQSADFNNLSINSNLVGPGQIYKAFGSNRDIDLTTIISSSGVFILHAAIQSSDANTYARFFYKNVAGIYTLKRLEHVPESGHSIDAVGNTSISFSYGGSRGIGIYAVSPY